MVVDLDTLYVWFLDHALHCLWNSGAQCGGFFCLLHGLGSLVFVHGIKTPNI